MGVMSEAGRDMGKLAAQTELFRADTTWFHVFHALLRSKGWAEMSPTAAKIYITAKGFVNWKTGAAFPSLDTLEEYSGLSRPTITKALKELEALGHIRSAKTIGKKTIYTMLERVPITGGDGRPTAVATFDYLPGAVRQAVAELKNVIVSGELADGKYIHIETLNLTVNVAGNSIVQGNQAIFNDTSDAYRIAAKRWTSGELTNAEYQAELDRLDALTGGAEKG